MNKAIKNLKVALLLDSKSYGGIETHVANLAKGLHQSGHNVQIILLKNYGKHPVFESQKLLNSLLSSNTSILFLISCGTGYSSFK